MPNLAHAGTPKKGTVRARSPFAALRGCRSQGEAVRYVLLVGRHLVPAPELQVLVLAVLAVAQHGDGVLVELERYILEGALVDVAQVGELALPDTVLAAVEVQDGGLGVRHLHRAVALHEVWSK